MRAFIITAIMPDVMTQDRLLEAINRGIKIVAQENNFDEMRAITWHTQIIDRFDLKRQDI